MQRIWLHDVKFTAGNKIVLARILKRKRKQGGVKLDQSGISKNKIRPALQTLRPTKLQSVKAF